MKNLLSHKKSMLKLWEGREEKSNDRMFKFN